LEDVWSDEMKDIIRFYKDQVKAEDAEQARANDSPGTHGLTKNRVARIGRHFNADYIVRGRILEFTTREDPTWAPWQKGILPFVNGGATRIMAGFAATDAYDERNEMLTGATIGGILGNNANWPWSDDEAIWGLASNSANTVFWGAVGGGLGTVSYTSGKVDQVAVQMRIWVQEAATGNVIWTNRIRVLVSPESVFADNQYDALYNAAIEKGTTTLIDNFVANGL
jgi:hypothetical protein